MPDYSKVDPETKKQTAEALSAERGTPMTEEAKMAEAYIASQRAAQAKAEGDTLREAYWRDVEQRILNSTSQE